jgi:hypothetical protein
MGQYKVIQDIEAEDKLLGPLSFRQFIYLILVVVQLFVGYLMLTAPGPIKYFIIFLLPSLIFFAVLAAPFGHDQSNEIWLLAKVRFFFKPRRRIWDQTGMKDLVTITVPKKIERQLTKDFSREEAQNRLKALANTLDTRGWAVKNVGVNMFNQPAYQSPVANVGMTSPTDRLIDVSTADPIVSSETITTPFDELDSGISQQFSEHIAKTKQAQRDQMSHMTTIPAPLEEDNIDWFAPEAVRDTEVTPLPQPHKNIDNIAPDNNSQKAHENSLPEVKETAKPAIINPAINNDLSVATYERRAVRKVDEDNDEVVISLR